MRGLVSGVELVGKGGKKGVVGGGVGVEALGVGNCVCLGLVSQC